MAFRFPLQALLNLRESYERLEEMRLIALAQAIVRTRQKADLLAQEDLLRRAQLHSRMQDAIGASEAHYEEACSQARRSRRQELLQELAKLQERHAEQQQALMRARRDREILVTLRDHQREAYDRDQSHRQQQLLDDLHLMRRRLGGHPEGD